MANRRTRAGGTIRLRTQFKDDYGVAAQATNVVVHVFEPDVDYTDYINAYLVSGVAVYQGQGIFEYEFITPNDGPDGSWHDVWFGDLLLQTVSGVMSFDVTTGSTLTSIENQLFTNDLVQVTIASGLMATDGTSLSEEYNMEFLTTTSPSYSSPRKVRLEVGSFVSSLPDMILEMAIVEASLEADVLTWNPDVINLPLFKHARYEYVSCLASSILLTNTGPLLLRSKTLADLSVTYDTKGIENAMNRIRDCLDKWTPQLLSGGGAKAITQPEYVVKGELDPDRPLVSRSWQHTTQGDVPAANARTRRSDQRRNKRTWGSPGGKKWW